MIIHNRQLTLLNIEKKNMSDDSLCYVYVHIFRVSQKSGSIAIYAYMKCNISACNMSSCIQRVLVFNIHTSVQSPRLSNLSICCCIMYFNE